MKLGIRVRDKITGFEGMVTGYVTYLTGCNQALVAPKCKSDGSYVDSVWFDEQRLEVLEGKSIRLLNAGRPGADKPAPKR